MIKKADKNKARKKRHLRIRKNLAGTSSKPRLNVFRSNTNIYAQLIDDTKGVTILSSSTIDAKIENGSNIEAAKTIGKLIAEKAVKAKIESVVFDRGGYIYHGRVKALAEAAREAGLKF